MGCGVASFSDAHMWLNFFANVTLYIYRQRHVNSQNTVFSLAERYLPRELLQEIRMPVPFKKVVKRAKTAPRNKGKGKDMSILGQIAEE